MNTVTIPDILRDAVAAHKAGRIADAERLYGEALEREPENFNAAHLFGTLAAQMGKLDQGIALYRKAVAIRPEAAKSHANLAELLRRKGELEEAAKAFETALKLDAAQYKALNSLGIIRIAQERYKDAVECFRKAVKAAPDSADAWHNLGMAQHYLGKIFIAIRAYRRSLAIEPGRFETRARLAAALQENGDAEEAIAACRAALAAEAENPAVLRTLALAQAEASPAEAMETIDWTLQIAPERGELHTTRGMILRQAGDFERSFEAYRSALDLSGSRTAAYYGMALARKITPADEPIVAAMLEENGKSGLSADERCSLNFALGKALDDLGRYEEAILHFDTANRLWLEAMVPERTAAERAAGRKRYSENIDRMIAIFKSGGFDLYREHRSPSERPVLIVGMMRSGTTLTEQILASHPAVAAGGELPFWTKSMQGSGNRRRDLFAPREASKLAQAYLDALNRISASAARVTDKMPHNFPWVGLIHALFPNARIVNVRRNPIDIALSIYFTRFARRQHEFAYDRGDIVFFYKQYKRLMAHWRTVLPANRFLEIDYEDLVADQERVSRGIVAFCGLEWSDACLDFHKTERTIRTASAWQARQPLYKTSAARWRRYEPWLGEFRELLAEGEAESPLTRRFASPPPRRGEG